MKIIIKYIPNLITITRIIMTFLFIHAIEEQFVYGQNLNLYLTILFSAICLSDFVDGKIARKTNSTSIIGAKLDVFADLLYIILSYITLINIKILPFWFLVFVSFKFTEFIITSKFIKRNTNSLDKPFVFDKVGRIVSAIFLIIPGIVCIYKCSEISNINLIFNCFIYIIFIAGLYSSYLRIKSCFKIGYINNEKYIDNK
ncbi:CDP-diacylglycerol--glycerol-3-phosphate 3-phosphatidyltransferase [Clostridium puniceum]|uniref:CDP-diacylglycerol--glycerol-3-phosphate 3-phosphatidyltransferase n=1 Tax=Clostridium puniceum TaxID=29367 RepID=A0A1S8TXC0_9CLOT|nr:CDP-alcohol phosphatidyltransferase family protein [Clostridium puniceum]OOM82408.1 CDP-diacylglycerol--glycerol-3-phosphate 3-phosphatidyltransferase [Clostridium puniceum]